MKLDYDGSAGLAPLDPSEVEQGSEARDDGKKYTQGAIRILALIRQIFAQSLDLLHSAYARRAPFVAFRDISPVWRGNRPELGKAESLKMLRMRG